MALSKSAHYKDLNEKNSFFLLLIMLVVILGMTWLAYHFREELKISERLNDFKEQILSPGEISVKFNVLAGVGEKDLRIRLSIPCENLKQKYYIRERLPKIQHEMLMTMNRPDVSESIKQRDIKALKRHSLGVINRFSKKKVKKIYLEFFFFN